jgi:hypothetical protein
MLARRRTIIWPDWYKNGKIAKKGSQKWTAFIRTWKLESKKRGFKHAGNKKAMDFDWKWLLVILCNTDFIALARNYAGKPSKNAVNTGSQNKSSANKSAWPTLAAAFFSDLFFCSTTMKNEQNLATTQEWWSKRQIHVFVCRSYHLWKLHINDCDGAAINFELYSNGLVFSEVPAHEDAKLMSTQKSMVKIEY